MSRPQRIRGVIDFWKSEPKPLQPGEFIGNILDSRGIQVGKWSAGLCAGYPELEQWIRIDRVPGGYEKYFGRIPVSEIWPMAYLATIDVGEAYEGRGHGTRGLDQFKEQAKVLGAVIALVKIGWSSDDLPDGGQSRNRRFYSKNGWLALDGEQFDLPLAYLLLNK